MRQSSEFNVRIRDLANESYSLGKAMTNEELVRKTLRALSPRFKMKCTTIEEFHDLSVLKFDELIGSLMTFELSLPAVNKRNKGVALKSSISSQKEKTLNPQKHDLSDSDSEIEETFAMLAKNYKKMTRRFKQMRSSNVTPNVKDISQQQGQKSEESSYESRRGERSNKGKGIQCHECEGYGHIQRECANFLKRQKKGFIASLSDDDEEDSNSEQTSNYVAFTASTSKTSLDQQEEEEETARDLSLMKKYQMKF